MTDASLSEVGAIVRRHDPDRFFTALFAPAAGREALFTLYAFNHELARAREAVREPFAAMIRLQWWREVVEGARRRHEVAGPLGAMLDAGRLHAPTLLGMIAAREAEVEAIETVAAFEAYVAGSAGGVMVAAALALGMPDAERLRMPGAAYGVTGVLRSVGVLALQGRSVLPRDVEGAAGRATLVAIASRWVAGELNVPLRARAAALPVVLARLDLARGGPQGIRAGTDRLRVAWAALRGRL